MKKFIVTPSEMLFTQTKESIGGYTIPSTKQIYNNSVIEQYSLPKLGDDFLPIGERYMMWVVEIPFYSGKFYFKNLYEAQLFTYGIYL